MSDQRGTATIPSEPSLLARADELLHFTRSAAADLRDIESALGGKCEDPGQEDQPISLEPKVSLQTKLAVVSGRMALLSGRLAKVKNTIGWVVS